MISETQSGKTIGLGSKPAVSPRHGLGGWWRKRRETARFKRLDRRRVFSWIYQTNKWRDPESRSGSGSSIGATRAIRSVLRPTLDMLQVKFLLDLPCGDLNWMREVDLGGIEYIGADIVPELIDRLREEYPAGSFHVLDVCNDIPPAADMILMRDFWVHLSFEDARLALNSLCLGRFRYIGCTTFPEEQINRNKITGKHRKLNMQLEPFCWGRPLALLPDDDGPGAEGKCFGIWRFSQVVGVE